VSRLIVTRPNELLVAAFRDPANALKDDGSFLKPEGGRDEDIGGYRGDYSRTMRPTSSSKGPRTRTSGPTGGRGPAGLAAEIKPKDTEGGAGSLRDPESDVVIMALETIAHHPDPEAGPAVLELLRHPPAVKHDRWRHPVTYNAGDYSGYTTRPGFDEGRWRPSGRRGTPAHSTICPSCHAIRAHTSGPRAAKAIASCAARADAAARAKAVGQLRALLDDANQRSLPWLPR